MSKARGRIPYKPCNKCGCIERYNRGPNSSIACPVCAKVNSRKQMRKRQGLPTPTRPETSICECCGKSGQMRLDHNHQTGEFRGWLCQNCNGGIGILGDTVEALERAIQYLKGNLLVQVYPV